jgi:hypothetical protein
MVKSTFYLVAISALCLLDGATAFVAQRPTSRQFAALQMADAPETPAPAAPETPVPATVPATIKPEAAAAAAVPATPADTTAKPEAAAAPANTTAKPEAAPADKQSLYGVTLNRPDTYARCGACQTSFALGEDDLGEKGRGRCVTYFGVLYGRWHAYFARCLLILYFSLIFFH